MLKDLPPVSAKLQHATISWRAPTANCTISNMFLADGKQEKVRFKLMALSPRDDSDEKQSECPDQWECQWQGAGTNYSLIGRRYQTFRILYVMNDVLQSPSSAVYCPKYAAEWSVHYKSSKIDITAHNTRASVRSDAGTVRAKEPILRGMKVRLEFYVMLKAQSSDYAHGMVGVISSEFQQYQNARVPRRDSDLASYCYGMTLRNTRDHYFGGRKQFDWSPPRFETSQQTKIEVIFDFSSAERCVLEFRMQQKQVGRMELPVLGHGVDWYPIICLSRPNEQCDIRCID